MSYFDKIVKLRYNVVVFVDISNIVYCFMVRSVNMKSFIDKESNEVFLRIK